MSKLGVVLLVLAALAVGLWLGFNPHMHQQIVQSWQHARTAFVHSTASLHLPLGLSSTSRTTVHAQPPTAPVSTTATWKQITTAFDSLMASLHRLWLNISARI